MPTRQERQNQLIALILNQNSVIVSSKTLARKLSMSGGSVARDLMVIGKKSGAINKYRLRRWDVNLEKLREYRENNCETHILKID